MTRYMGRAFLVIATRETAAPVSAYESWARDLFRLMPDTSAPGMGYEPPGPTHERLLFDRDHLTFIVSGGERGAKSWTTAMKATLLTLEYLSRHPEEAAGKVAWVVASTYELTKTEMEDCLGPWLAAILPGVSISKAMNPGEITIPTISGKPFTIKTKSAIDPITLRAEAPVWVLLCEAATVHKDAYYRLLGRMGQIRGQFPGFGQLIASGTFEGGQNWYAAEWTKYQSPEYQRRDMTISLSLPSHENPFAWPGGEQSPELAANKRMLPEDVYLERHLAVPAPPTGRVHPRFDVKRHIKRVHYDPDLPIYIGNDPGYAHPNAVEVLQKKELFTERGDKWEQWQLIDEIYTTERTVEEVCSMVMQRPWWKNEHKVGVVDIAGQAHAGQREPYAQVWQKLTGMHLMSQRVNILPGIDRMNTMLEDDPVSHEPRFVVDPSCEGFIAEMGGGPNPVAPDAALHPYSWQFDRQGNRVGRTPKDEYNDATKAVTYLFVNQLGYATSRQGIRRRGVINLGSNGRYAVAR